MTFFNLLVVQCDKCRGMLRATTGDDTPTQDVGEAKLFSSAQVAVQEAHRRGWQVWFGWDDKGNEEVRKIDCPEDRKKSEETTHGHD